MASSRMTAEIGRVLGGRYRVIAPIGVGASAQVYLADDIRLGRRVALKMLHDALAGDMEFLRRFRAEARAAAALSHPNVLAVYDWGDGEVAFIVTEYLAGGSLRSLLDQGSLLSTSQALTIGLEATRALDYAHRRGFVHRDIKPANLLFGEDNRLRIADFGLARALAEAAWTEPQGAMLGTARYAAPEQAKGEHLDGKADVYSLALLLVEAVTGEVPFAADTMLGTLMARVDRPLVVPDALGPLQEILEQAGRPDPEDRIDARAMAAGLLRAAKALPRPEALPLVGAMSAEAMAELDEPQAGPPPTPVPPEAAAAPEGPVDLRADDLDLDPPDWVNLADPAIEAEPEPERIEVADAVAAAPDPDPSHRPEGRRSVIVAPVRGDGPSRHGGVVERDEDGDHHEVDERRRRRWPWVAAVLLLVLIGAGGYAAATQLGTNDTPETPALVLPVPSLTGLAQADAEAVAEAAGWKTSVTTERRDDTVTGDVLSSSPASGARLARGGTVALVVSAGQTEVAVPQDLRAKPLADAKAALEAFGLAGEQTEDRFDEDVPEGAVLALADGTPAKLERGSTVGLVVSRGAEPRTVPDGIVGSTEAEATQKLADVGLKVAIDRRFNDDVPEGEVVSQRPRPGEQLPRGGVVTIEVSRGPELVAVPDVSAAVTSQEAAALIRAAGLVPGSVSGSSEGTPTSTDPGTGTQVKTGSTVDIVLG